MGGKYSVHDIDKALVRKWMDGELTPDLHVPQANKYLAESLELKSSEKSLGTHIREWIKSQKLERKNLIEFEKDTWKLEGLKNVS